VSALRLGRWAGALALLLVATHGARAIVISVPLEILLDEADAVVRGRIVALADAGFRIGARPYEVAILEPDEVLKHGARASGAERLRIAQPGSGTIAVSTDVRFRPGQQGIWILNADEERDVFWARHPFQLQRSEARDEIERLLRARERLPGGEAVRGLVARAERVEPAGSAARGPAPLLPELRFSLRNVGDAPVVVCLGGRPLGVEWTGPDGRPDPARSRPRDALPGPPDPDEITQRDFVTIPPGGIRFLGGPDRYSALPLAGAGAATEASRLEPGEHRIVLRYASREDGRRFGLEGVWTGEVAANPVVIRVD
jgi:hypothetical protein